jgi:pre-mRNA-splicing helicase BRR2
VCLPSNDSNSFRQVRQEENLARLLDRHVIPVKEGDGEPAAKINVLLPAYISQLTLGLCAAI